MDKSDSGPAWQFWAPLPAAEPSDDPLASALAWLEAYRTVRFDDPTPTAWIDRVRPVVTGRLGTEYEQYRQGTVGSDWTEFVAARCASTVENTGGVIPAEAPRSATTVSVQVAGSLRTRCQDEHAPARPDESLAATVTLARGNDGRWRVDRRLY